ncbi:hypothetical protein [Streptomyces sp. NPDC090022]|uniref:hypothetical protein n=1 Tax=Streptomyces sp. NPDC090022 TaxID=3365920 RepID=UPI0038261C9C
MNTPRDVDAPRAPRVPDPDGRTGLLAALGLGLFALGGWLINTTRPWNRPFDLTLLLTGWGLSLAALAAGVVLTLACVRAVHRTPDPVNPTHPTHPADPTHPGRPTHPR